MAQPIIVATGEPADNGGGDAATAFAAGAATVVAAQAAETSEAAVDAAVDAAASAEQAERSANDAWSRASEALEAVAQLEAKVTDLVGDLVAIANGTATPMEADDGAPEVIVSGDGNAVKVADVDTGETDTKKGKRKKGDGKFGSSLWFGDRD
jgi:hypothetical protein